MSTGLVIESYPVLNNSNLVEMLLVMPSVVASAAAASAAAMQILLAWLLR